MEEEEEDETSKAVPGRGKTGDRVEGADLVARFYS